MINKRVLFVVEVSLVCLLLLFTQQNQRVFAAFSLSVEPVDGGYDLRFGKVDVSDIKVVKELTIRITTDIGRQYRVFQRVEKPLTTADGIEIERDQFKMYTLIDSNSKGTLERIEEYPVMPTDTALYTSNTAGEGDSFKLVYTLEPSMSQTEGSYHGRMQFILLPIDSSQEQVVGTIQMYADLTNEGMVEISTDTGIKSIRISSKDLDAISMQYPLVSINIKGNLGTRYRIYQELNDGLIKSAGGDKFDLSKVIYSATEADNGAVVKQGDLSDLRSKGLIYASDDLGSANTIAIEYQPTKDFSQQKAGLYFGLINYYIETDKTTGIGEGAVDSVDVEFNIEPVFRIIASAISEDGEVAKEGMALIQFGNVVYRDGANIKESKVLVKIESNLEKPYMVTQKLGGPLQNEQGNKIPSELFTFLLEKEIDTDSKLKFDKETITEPEKDTAIFVSNNKGESDEFEITYKLRITADTRGGDYSTGISYSLSEL